MPASPEQTSADVAPLPRQFQREADAVLLRAKVEIMPDLAAGKLPQQVKVERIADEIGRLARSSR